MTQADEQSVSIVLDGTETASNAAVIRAALALATITKRPVSLLWAPDSPGLSPEGLAAITAWQAVLGGACSDAVIGARELTCDPQAARVGSGRIDLGNADLAPVMEMISLPLALSGAQAELKLAGITHNTASRSFHELVFGWLPLVERLGFAGELKLDAAGFLPDGAGQLSIRTFPSPRLHAVDLTQRGMLVEVQCIVLLANLRMGIAMPLEQRLNDRLRTCGIAAQTEVLPLPADRSRGLAVVIVAQFEKTRVAFSSVGAPGRSAEAVADEAVDRLIEFLRRRGAVPGEVAEQLLIPLALASSSCAAPGAIRKEAPGTSRMTTSRITGTLLALAQVARRFLDIEMQVQGLPGDEGLVEVRPAVAP